MAKFTEALSESSKELWPVLYEYFTKKKWKPPKKDKRAIKCDVKLEGAEEIGQLIRKVPNPTRRE